MAYQQVENLVAEAIDRGRKIAETEAEMFEK